MMIDQEQLMKRCQRGATNLNDANNLLADCYGTLGAMSAEIIRIKAMLAEWDRSPHGNVILENMELRKDVALGRVATKYIDRLCDPAESDPLETIVEEYIAAFSAAMSKEG